MEALTYRLAGHSTADDPTRYQPAEEVALWQSRDPITRFRRFLFTQNLLDEKAEQEMIREVEAEVAEQVRLAYEYPVREADSFFDNVYGKLPPRLKRQRAALKDNLHNLPD